MAQRRLLYIIGIKPTKIGGIEIFVRELGLQMARRNCDLVLCFEASPSEQVTEFLRSENIFFEVLENQGTFSLGQLVRLAGIIRKHRPRVMLYAFNGILRAYPWLARLMFVPEIYYNDHSSRAIGFVAKRRPLIKRMLARAITRPVNGSICVSGYVKACAEKDGFLPADRIFVVYNGVDLERVNRGASKRNVFRESLGISAEELVVLQVCWMVPVKGVETLLRAAAQVVDRCPGIRFVLVGDGEKRHEYEMLAEELGISRKVVWTGVVANPTEEGVFAAADVYCQCSQWEEAFGLSILEAMSFSLPVIATRVGGIPELVSDGACGLLISRGDENALAENIVRLASDERVRRQMGEESRKRAETLFDVRRTAALYLQRCGITNRD